MIELAELKRATVHVDADGGAQELNTHADGSAEERTDDEEGRDEIPARAQLILEDVSWGCLEEGSWIDVDACCECGS